MAHFTSHFGQRPPINGPRDPGDAWAVGDRGKFWGRFGAAGLLVHDPDRGILLQHRVAWSHHGDTWGLPGGALHQGENAVTGALREAYEEAAVPASLMRVLLTSVYDIGYWSYTTVVARTRRAFAPVISDPESLDLQWVPLDLVDSKPLHPGFATAWPRLWPDLLTDRYLVIDAANVVGSRPDGWWRDRKKAAQRLIDDVSTLARRGIESTDGAVAWPSIIVVTEGRARGAGVGLGTGAGVGLGTGAGVGLGTGAGQNLDVGQGPGPGPSAGGEQVADVRQNPEHMGGAVQVVEAERDGDQAIVDTVGHLAMTGAAIRVITADRELRSRVGQFGASVEGPGWLWARLDRAD